MTIARTCADAESISESISGWNPQIRPADAGATIQQSMGRIMSKEALRPKDEESEPEQNTAEFAITKYDPTPGKGAEWRELGSSGQEGPPGFPGRVFAPWVQVIVASIALSTQTPPDMAAMMVLGALAICCQGKARVRIRPDYSEQLSLFLICTMSPGDRKSAVTQLVAAPLQDWEREKRAAMKPTVSRAQDQLDIELQKLKLMKSALARRSLGGQAAEDVCEVLQDLVDYQRSIVDAIVVPVMPRLLTDDVTPQMFSTLVAENGGRMGVLSGEPGLFESLIGNRISVVLKGFSGDEVRVDRVSREGENIPSPAITLGLALQPELLRGLAKRKGARGRGLLGRFLYSMPASLMGNRDTDPPALHPGAKRSWAAGVDKLLSLPILTDASGRTLPREIPLAPEAAALFRDFSAEVEDSLAQGGDLASLLDWGGKIPGAIARIAGLLHLSNLVQEDQLPSAGDRVLPAIPAGTMASAIETYPYFKAHAKAAFSMMGYRSEQSDAEYLLDVIRKKGAPIFLRQACWQWCKGRFASASDLDAALDVLIRRGFLRREVRREGPGRPGTCYVVNPAVFQEG